jgi:ATP-dependent DNA helicase RecQ
MKKFTANYSFSNHNFVIQNLSGERITNSYLPAVCIVKNILQRGKPTLMSTYLQDYLGSLHKEDSYFTSHPLIDRNQSKWNRVIRGDEKGNYYPAQKFIDELFLKYLPEYAFLQQLIIPEVPINEITKVEVDEYVDRQVDFYLPQAHLIIEIDGSQHNDNDIIRDSHTAKYGLKTVRIKTSDLESENSEFLKKIEEIKKRIENVSSKQENRKESDKTFISIGDYKIAFEKGVDTNDSNYKATAVIRFQILVLELLEYGLLDFNKTWNFEILERDVTDFAHLAINDLSSWFKTILKLQKIDFQPFEFNITKVGDLSEFSNDDVIKVDFSLLKRYTDEFQTNSDILFVRTDYLDEFLYFKKGNSVDQLLFHSFESYDYFKISTTTPYKYDLKFDDKDSDEEPLLFLLWNIFLQTDDRLNYQNINFREGQIPIIVNALSRNDTIGLLPTGSGKSVCYQLSVILQPSISFVVCPIKSLMYDQKADMDSSLFTRVNHISSDDDAEDRERIQNEFGEGKYFFILVSPERFQVETFRNYLSSVNEKYSIAYAIIDEVHCLSEWGHDFRTSYLNLSNAIQRYCTNFNFIGLTATASINVLKDIQIEFGINQENVKAPFDFTREELEFYVIDDGNDKFKSIKQLLELLKDKEGAFELNEKETKCGIIFTPTVNGKNGCYQLSVDLSQSFNTEVKYYSGSVPEINKVTVMKDIDYDMYKKQVQNDFKQNKFSLLTATKAFGMGINKGNIHYTFHYGIPSSMESLYQEAGRAGRDKTKFVDKKASCYVLLSKTDNESILEQIWTRQTSLSKIQTLQKKVRGDLNTNLFLFSSGLDIITDEFKSIHRLYSRFAVSGSQNVEISGDSIGCDKFRTEKAIYRLRQLGVVKDWTVENFFRSGSFKVDFSVFTDESIKESLLTTINKYDPEFNLESLVADEKYHVYNKILNAPEEYSLTEKYFLILLQWSYDNFAYNRRQSLKNIYENCCKYSDGIITSSEFKLTIENYFKFTEVSFTLQYISEKPKDFKKWFEVFYQMDNNIVTNSFITQREQIGLRDNLSRFLESYMHNTGLDLISGISRLLLDDYDNADGRSRFESSISQIKQYEPEDVDSIIGEILKVGQIMSEKNKSLLSESIQKHIDSPKITLQLAQTLRDQYSSTKFVNQSTNRLKKIKNTLYGRL